MNILDTMSMNSFQSHITEYSCWEISYQSLVFDMSITAYPAMDEYLKKSEDEVELDNKKYTDNKKLMNWIQSHIGMIYTSQKILNVVQIYL